MNVVDDRALHYGDGLFETMRMCHGEIALFDSHMARLTLGAERLQLPAPDISQISQLILEHSDSQTNATVKLIYSRGAGGQGYFTADRVQPAYYVFVRPLPSEQANLKLTVSEMRLPVPDPLAGIKHLNRLPQVLMAKQIQATEFDEALVYGSDGHLIEAIANNVFFLKNGIICTPSLKLAGVAGVYRQMILRRAALKGIPIQEGCYTAHDLQDVEQIMLCNAVRGCQQVAELSHRVLLVNAELKFKLDDIIQ